MSIIYSYPEQGALNANDMLIGTSAEKVGGKQKNITRNFSVQQIADFINGGAGFIDPVASDFQIAVFNQAGKKITGSIMSQDAFPNGTGITISGNLTTTGNITTPLNLTANGVVSLGGQANLISLNSVTKLGGPIQDATGTLGNVNQILLSNGSGVVTWQNYEAGLTYEGTWDASNNTTNGLSNSPALVQGVGVSGHFYIVNAEGTTSLGPGLNDWHVGDWAVFLDEGGQPASWQKIDNTSVLTGSGTDGVFARWTDATTINDSLMSQVGTEVIINGELKVKDTIQATTGPSTNLKLKGVGTGGIEIMSADGVTDGKITLNCSQNSHGVTLQSPPHASGATYTLILPTSFGGAGDVLTSAGANPSQLVWTTPTTGTVTSVGISTDVAAFTVGSSPITSSGVLTLNKNGGTAGQYIDGDTGSWVDLPSGDTYTLSAGAKSGTSVPLNLDAAAGADSVVNLTEGTGITLTRTSATEVTIAGSAQGVTGSGTVNKLPKFDTSTSLNDSIVTQGGGTTTITPTQAGAISFNSQASSFSMPLYLTRNTVTGPTPQVGDVFNLVLQQDLTWAVGGGVIPAGTYPFTITFTGPNDLSCNFNSYSTPGGASGTGYTNLIGNGSSTSVSSSSNLSIDGELSMLTNKIINVAQPTAAQDAATKNYVDAIPTGVMTFGTSDSGATITVSGNAPDPRVKANTTGGVGAGSTSLATGAQIQTAITNSAANYLPLAGGTMTGAIALPGSPTLALEAATKSYVDNTLAGSGSLIFQGSYDAVNNVPNLTSGTGILKGWTYAVTAGPSTSFWSPPLNVGDLVIANIDNPASASDWTEVQSNIGVAGSGTTDLGTVKGLAGFNSNDFTVSNSGWVEAKDFSGSTPGYVPDATGATAGTFLKEDGTWSTAGVAGTGTQNYVTKWSAGGAGIEDSTIFDNGTNVGIGTTSPSTAKLVIETGPISGIDLYRSGVNANFEAFRFRDSSNANTEASIGWGGDQLRLNSTNNTVFTTAGSERMRIDSSGNVGIGTTSPVSALHVSTTVNEVLTLQSITSSQKIKFNDINNPADDSDFGSVSGDLAMFTNSNGTPNTQSFTFNKDGKLGIGQFSTSPQANLDISDLNFNPSLRLYGANTGSELKIEVSNFFGNFNTTINSAQNDLIFQGNNSAIMSLGVSGSSPSLPTGSLRLNQYGQGTKTGIAVYNLTVDGFGNVIEDPISGGASATITSNQTTTSNATTTVFLLGATPNGNSVNFVDVFIDGVYQETTTYSVSGASFDEITFNSPVPSGVTVETKTTADYNVGAAVDTVSLGQSNTTGNVDLRIVPLEVTSGQTIPGNANSLYIFTATGAQSIATVTLPGSPTLGDSIKISNLGGLANVLGANGNKIMGVAQDLTINTPTAAFEIIWSGSNNGWIIIGNV